MCKSNNELNERLKYHVTGAIERGEAEPIEAIVESGLSYMSGLWVIAPPLEIDGVSHRGNTQIGVESSE